MAFLLHCSCMHINLSMMPGCVLIMLVVSVFGGCGLLFGGCKRHHRMMMYVASSTRSQLPNNSFVRGWKNWEDENLAVIYTVSSTRSHHKKGKNCSVRRWKQWEDENLVVVYFCEQYFLLLRYWIPYPMYVGSVNRWFKVGCDASSFLFGKAQHPTTNNMHKNTKNYVVNN